MDSNYLWDIEIIHLGLLDQYKDLIIIWDDKYKNIHWEKNADESIAFLPKAF